MFEPIRLTGPGRTMFREKDRKTCERLCEKYYAGRKFSRAQYQELIRQHVAAGHRLLDAGCGRDLEFSREFSDDVQVVGIDMEPDLQTRNQSSPYAVRGDLERLPFPSDSFDLIISRSVIEHLADPPRVFSEFHRTLKPGGKVILSTPNKYDYVSILASITPYRWHQILVSKIVGVSEDDVFPTLYRANTLSALRKKLTGAGFTEKELRAINHYPVYLMFSPLLFRLGILYERLTALHFLRFLRGTLLCVFEKLPAGAPAADLAGSQAEQIPLSSVGV
jgi:SAM-dependent methyltransferase